MGQRQVEGPDEAGQVGVRQRGEVQRHDFIHMESVVKYGIISVSQLSHGSTTTVCVTIYSHGIGHQLRQYLGLSTVYFQSSLS